MYAGLAPGRQAVVSRGKLAYQGYAKIRPKQTEPGNQQIFRHAERIGRGTAYRVCEEADRRRVVTDIRVVEAESVVDKAGYIRISAEAHTKPEPKATSMTRLPGVIVPQ